MFNSRINYSKINTSENLNTFHKNKLFLNSSCPQNKFSEIINKSSFIQYKLKSRNIKNKINKCSSADYCSNIKQNLSFNIKNYGNLTNIQNYLNENQNLNPFLMRKKNLNVHIFRKIISRDAKNKYNNNIDEESIISKKTINKRINSSCIENESFLRKCLGINKKELNSRQLKDKNNREHLINLNKSNSNKNNNKLNFFLNKQKMNNNKNYFYSKYFKYKLNKNTIQRTKSNIINSNTFIHDSIVYNNIECPEESHFLIVDIIQKTNNKNIENEKNL